MKLTGMSSMCIDTSLISFAQGIFFYSAQSYVLHVVYSGIIFRKTLYQNVYEYDLPVVSPEPKVFEFLQPYDSEHDNPWKDSFKMLVRYPVILLVPLTSLSTYFSGDVVRVCRYWKNILEFETCP